MAVEFWGRVIGNSGMPWFHTGKRIKGYFTYEPGVASGQQTSSQFNFFWETPEDGGRFWQTSYAFVVYNNWSMDGLNLWDGLILTFSYPYGYGTFSLRSSNLSLFPDNMTPPTIPAFEQFDAGRGFQLTVDQVQPYLSMAATIDRIFVVPNLGLPLIHAIERTQAGVSFRFRAEPSTSYVVEVTRDLAHPDWQTLTNVAPTIDAIAVINDAVSASEQRFYRILKIVLAN